MKTVISLIRWFVGLLFIFSGLIKANDPLGLSYKMQEFFEVWGWHFLNDYTLVFSLGMNVLEVVAGVAVIVGWRKRSVSWMLLLLIIFFTFLTGYFSYAATFGKIAVQDLQVPLFFNRVGKRANDILFFKIERGNVCQIFRNGFTGDGQAVAVQQTFH